MVMDLHKTPSFIKYKIERFMLLVGWISPTAVPGNIIICSPLLIDWRHILGQSPFPISFVKVIAWQIAWLNKVCVDQVNLLSGFDSTIIYVALPLCLLPSCLWVIFVLYCRGMFSFEPIQMDFKWFSTLLFLLVRILSYVWFFLYHSKISCSFCTSLARLWCLIIYTSFKKKTMTSE